MSAADFEDLIDSYRKESYTRAVEDFLTAFEACGFYSDELLFAFSDAFHKRGLHQISVYLSHAAESVPLSLEGNAQFEVITNS